MVRLRFYRIALSFPVIIFSVGMAMALLTGSENLTLFRIDVADTLIVAGLVLQIVFALIIACPRCGKSPYAIGPTWGPFAVAGKPFPDAQCSRCGYDFVAAKQPEA